MKINRLVLILLIIALLPEFSFSQKLPSKEIVNAFLKSKTYIVYDVGMFSSYNFYIKDVIEKEWTITEYEFISYDEFKEKRKENNSSFLVLTDVSFNDDKSGTVYNFLNLILGGKYRTISEMPDIINFPLSVSGQDEDLYVYKLPAIIRFIQNHVLMLKQDPGLAGENIENVYKIKETGFKGKTFCFLKEELSPEINTSSKIKKIIPNSVKIITKEEIEKAIADKKENVIFLHIVGSNSNNGNKQCFKVLFGADDSEIYLFSHHKINKRNGNFLLKKDLIKIANLD